MSTTLPPGMREAGFSTIFWKIQGCHERRAILTRICGNDEAGGVMLSPYCSPLAPREETGVAGGAISLPRGDLREGYLREGYLREGYLREGYLREGYLPLSSRGGARGLQQLFLRSR